MNIDFPLLLVVLTAVAGLVWLLDKLVLRKRRHDKGGDGAAVPFYVEFTAPFFPVLLVVLILRSFIVEPFQIPSGSMIPTLRIGDFILVNKFAYGLRLPVLGTKVVDIGEPQRGDVMVFFPPGDDRYFIKRVIGLPGDEIQILDNNLYVNGAKMPQMLAGDVGEQELGYRTMEENLDGKVHLMRKRIPPTAFGRNVTRVVPEGHYFMVGDNRDNSYDSRAWGPVPEQNIVGKAFLVWMHWESLWSLPGFDGAGKIH